MTSRKQRQKRLEEIQLRRMKLEQKRMKNKDRRNSNKNKQQRESRDRKIEELLQESTGKSNKYDQPIRNVKSTEENKQSVSTYSPHLSEHKSVVSVDIQPRVIEKYNRETQTKRELPKNLQEQLMNQTMKEQNTENIQIQTQTQTQTQTHFQNTNKVNTQETRIKELKKTTELTTTERNEIIDSAGFQKFFDYGSRIVERVLNEPFDLLKDYTGSINDEDDMIKPLLSNKIKFYDEKWSKFRSVTDLQWSPKHPELMLASYSKREWEMSREPEGVVLLWSLASKSRPEFVFTSQSQITSSIFSTFHPSIVIGGTYSGKILVWDSRKKGTPVMRSSHSSKAHTHPIYGMSIVGSENAHSLVSVSNDGHVCTWSLDMLTTPTETIDLSQKSQNAVSPTTMVFPENEMASFFIGCENGSIYSVLRHGIKVGINNEYKGHNGPITGIDFHRSKGDINFSDLYLTSSFDWKINLWSKSSTSPLLTFEESNEYVYDVKWSPIHPSLFASVNGGGELFVWDFNRDNEEPLVKIKASESAINKCRWSQDGRKIVTGDSEAVVEVFELSEEVAIPKKADWSKMQEKRINLRPMYQKEDQNKL
ncbi:cytoplasmic dynein 1 intermediate chain-related [Anaeramoeba flamelloides]|uniref:Cytoplasmic dynein 1 intermediate chain-related n=1 Tax=Anaeramoeba flamelloides TaxID=1746091 RepID=A0AAV7YNA4_9EUKA|nr:cytoplasmic dynein 1 intermediate chain-related [Anaeramoeba flamelloides]